MQTPNVQSREDLLEVTSRFMEACIIGAAAELDLFTVIGRVPLEAKDISRKIHADLRATTILCDALVALGLLEKNDGKYVVKAALVPFLVEGSEDSVLPMLRHRMNVLRSWCQLPWIVRAGIPAPRSSSMRGPIADIESFVEAMHVISNPIADEVIAKLQPLSFRHLLDVGGATGTWTLAFLRACPNATAVIFDLPIAIMQAKKRLAKTDLAARVELVAGDYLKDPLPHGADFAWVSAVIHQHSREQNRKLFQNVHAALQAGGTIAIRDVVMEPNRCEPPFGAIFAVNMLVNTEGGGTYTFEEIAEDLQAAGFSNPELVVKQPDMNSIVVAIKS